jgi:hypothetical protein
VSRYRKLDPRFWNDEKVRRLSDDGKLAFLFILTHPHLTALGAMRCTVDGLAAELGWPLKRFRVAITPAIECGMVEVNEPAAYIGLPNFLRYNDPEGPNSVKKAWVDALDRIPECEEKRALILRCKKYLGSKSTEFRDAIGDAIWDDFADAIPDAYRDPSPILELELEQERTTSSDATPSGIGTNGDTAADLFNGNGHSPATESGHRRRRPSKRSVQLSAPAGFTRFYDAYPRKEDKPRALVAWTKLGLETQPALQSLIVADVARRLDSGEWETTPERRRFIPHPASYLNGRRWEDAAPAAAHSAANGYPAGDDSDERYPYFSTCRTCNQFHQEGVACSSAEASR